MALTNKQNYALKRIRDEKTYQGWYNHTVIGNILRKKYAIRGNDGFLQVTPKGRKALKEKEIPKKR